MRGLGGLCIGDVCMLRVLRLVSYFIRMLIRKELFVRILLKLSRLNYSLRTIVMVASSALSIQRRRGRPLRRGLQVHPQEGVILCVYRKSGKFARWGAMYAKMGCHI